MGGRARPAGLRENDDIDRSGYHDTHDITANIDLDYGAALAATEVPEFQTEPNRQAEEAFPKAVL